NQISVAFITPDELRDAKAAQGAGRCAIGVERVRIDADVFDVVWPRRGEAGFLRDPRPDIRIGTAVPIHLASARDDTAILVHAAFDTKCRRVFGDHVELLFHRQCDLDGTTDHHGERGDQRFELDVDFRPIAAAEIRYFDAHAA